jgi:hypothetical protein
VADTLLDSLILTDEESERVLKEVMVPPSNRVMILTPLAFQQRLDKLVEQTLAAQRTRRTHKDAATKKRDDLKQSLAMHYSLMYERAKKVRASE